MIVRENAYPTTAMLGEHDHEELHQVGSFMETITGQQRTPEDVLRCCFILVAELVAEMQAGDLAALRRFVEETLAEDDELRAGGYR